MTLIGKNTVASCGLDRHLNVYFKASGNLPEHHIYLKSKLSCLLPIEVPEEEESDKDDEDFDDDDGEEGGEISDDLEDDEQEDGDDQ